MPLQIIAMKTTLLSTAYLPPIEYILKCMQGPVTLEVCEHYIKQSYRNRALIATANGIQVLSIPVVHISSKMPILDVRIDFATPWQRLHWKSIDTAYSGSPYFLYFQDYIRPFYEKKFDFLFDFNLELTQVILKLFGKDFQPQQTKEFIADYLNAVARPATRSPTNPTPRFSRTASASCQTSPSWTSCSTKETG